MWAPSGQQTAIGNSRIQRIDEEAGTVTFSYRNNHGKRNEWGQFDEETVTGETFIDRFLRHVLPYRFMRARTWGFWSNRSRNTELAALRHALGATGLDDCSNDTPDAEQKEEATGNRMCPECEERTLEPSAHIPKPSVASMMHFELLPSRHGWSLAGWTPKGPPPEVQKVLPQIGPFLHGGVEYGRSVAANRAVPSGHGSRDTSKLGFT